MAASRNRPEKSVLNRQAINRRRKLSSPAEAPEPLPLGAVAGLFLLAGAAIALIALLTYSVHDRTGSGYRNWAGPFGHAIAEAMYGWLGICAYAVPILGSSAAFSYFRGRRVSRRWMRALAGSMLLSSALVWAELLGRPANRPYSPGGWLGHELTLALAGWLSTVGTGVLVAAWGVGGAILLYPKAFFTACRVGRSGLGWSTEMGALGLAKVWGLFTRLLEARRAAAARAKLEEEAFLAQLEADEEEGSPQQPTEDELDAEEAALAAEEVARTSAAPELPRPSRKKPTEEKSNEPAWVKDAPITRLPAPRLPEGLDAPAAVVEASPERALALAPPRMPVIVEPKPPPKSKRPESTQDKFEFIGDRTQFTPPPIDVLECDKPERSALDKDAFLATAAKLRAKLADFGIVGEVVEIRPGPVVTMYEFLPGPGIKVSKIASLADDLAMAMEAMRVRIVAPIPGKGVVGIEVPNKDRETVFLKEIAQQDVFIKSTSKLTMCLGKDIEGMPYVLDLAKSPHLLIAGTTGSGKSVAVNSMIMSLLLKATPEEVRFIMVDPKMLELSVYEGIPHLLLPVVTDPKKAALALRWAVEEMERRYHLLSEAGVRNIAGYNKLVESASSSSGSLLAKQKSLVQPPPRPAKKTLIVDVADGESEDAALERSDAPELGVPIPAEPVEEIREALAEEATEDGQGAPAATPQAPTELKKLPYLVVIIDELADLMMVASREVETYIARLAQMARAAGIHLMVATQRPSTDVVTGVIKANFPTRITFMLRSKPDSMTILGTTGAEALLGMGDMLLMPPTSAHLQRVHGAYVSETEIKRAVDHLKAQGKPVYDESILQAREGDLEGGPEEDDLSDQLYDQALATVSEMRQVSISMLQRKMRIGYNRAARMIERMEREGVVGPADGAKPRDVLIRPLGEMPGAGAM